MEKWGVITGATSGIGKSFAYYYAEQGYNLILTGTREILLKQVIDDIKSKYLIDVICFIGNLGISENHDKLLNIIEDKPITLLINNAGYGYSYTFDEGDLNEFLNMIQLHTSLVVKLTHAVLPYMKDHNEGVIINVSSNSAYAIVKKNAVYSGTKAFIKQFTHGVYMDMKEYNIKVLALCPGFTKTDAHKRMGIDVKRQNNKFLRWASPEFVVSEAVKAMNRDKAICITGLSTKFQVFLSICLPKKLYYKLISATMN